MFLKRRKREPFGIREDAQIRSPGHLAWVRGHECAVRNEFCSERVEAAHVRNGTDGGTSLKPSDSWALPLCSYHHRAQHQHGETTFSRHYKINMKEIAADLWKRSPHRLRHERRQGE
jgi:hypothetical protein